MAGKIRLLVLIFLGIFLIGNIIALSTQDIIYQIKINYQQSCTDDCSNVTSENLTTQNCNHICFGILKILPYEETNHIAVVETLNISFEKIYSGYKTATLGNDTDITGLTGVLNQYANNCSIDLNRCKDANRNFNDLYLNNLTICANDKTNLQNSLNNKQIELDAKIKEISDTGTKNWWFLIGGIVGGILLIKWVIPLSQGLNIQKDRMTQGMPKSNAF